MSKTMAAAIAVALFAIGMLPSFPPTPPPLWRSEAAVTASAVAIALVTYVLTWAHVARVRAGGGRSRFRLESVVARIADAWPRRQKPFSSAAAGQLGETSAATTLRRYCSRGTVFTTRTERFEVQMAETVPR